MHKKYLRIIFDFSGNKNQGTVCISEPSGKFFEYSNFLTTLNGLGQNKMYEFSTVLHLKEQDCQK